MVGTLVDLVKDLVVVPIASVVKALIVELTKPIVALKNEVLGVLREVAGFVKLIIKTGLEIFFAFFTMWNHAVMNKVIRSLGFPKMFEVSPLTAFVITCIFLSLPIIGGWIGILGMVTKYSTKLLTVPFSLFEFILNTIEKYQKVSLIAVILVSLVFGYKKFNAMMKNRK